MKLKALSIGVALDRPFSQEESLYYAFVPYAKASIPLLAEAEAPLLCNGQPLSEQELPLQPGDNAFVLSSPPAERTVTLHVIRSASFKEELRPRFHFTPDVFSLNDPNGLWYNARTGEYHMYFQRDCLFRTRFAIENNQKSWGHAVSRDLVNWEERPLVLTPDENGTIWSGSAVVDEKNCSKFFPDSVPPEERVIVFFTYYGGTKPWHGQCCQSLAYSLDGGNTFIKPMGSPILPNFGNRYQPGMRDPKVFWLADAAHKNGGEWVMLLAGGRAQLFVSDDLVHWKHERDLSLNGQPLDSECPDLYPMPLDGNKDNTIWVYSGAGVFYILGQLARAEDGRLNFTAQSDKIYPTNGVSELFPGTGPYPEMYAAQTFYNDPYNRRVEISWLRDLLGVPGKPWYNAESLSLELKLESTPEGPRIKKLPVKETETLRGEKLLETSLSLAPGENPLQGLWEELFEIEANFSPAVPFAFSLRQGEGKELSVRYENGSLLTDKTNVSEHIAGVYATPLAPLPNESVSVRILVDSSIVDVFGNNGAVFHSGMTFASPNHKGMELRVEKPCQVTLRVWRLQPMSRVERLGKLE